MPAKKLLLFVLFLAAFNSLAQRNHLDVPVTVSLDQVPMVIVLDNIELKGGFYFSYNSDYFNKDSLVSVQARRKKVKKILKVLIPSSYSYKSIGQHVVIYREVEEKENFSISGYISDAFTGERLNDVSIYKVGSHEVILSLNGKYEVLVAPGRGKTTLSFSKLGYEDKIVYVDPKSEELKNIALVPLEQSIEGLTAKNIDSSYRSLEDRNLVKWVVPRAYVINSNNLKLNETRPFQVSFLPFLGTNGRLSGTVSNNFSFNIIGGYSHSVKGIEIGGMLNIDRKTMEGTQIAGFANLNGGYTKGIQIAGFSNYSGESTYGVQAAGMSNLTIGNMEGLQLAGFVNVLHGKMDGLQFSGFNNVSTYDVNGTQLTGFVNVAVQNVELAQISGFANYAKNVNGLQLAGFGNIALEDVNKLQVAGFMNVAQRVKYLQLGGFANIGIHENSGFQLAGFLNFSQKVRALQMAGFTNISLKESRGVQISGFFNYASQVDGFQLAVFNYADTISSGIPVGFFSVVRKGLHRIEASADELFPFNLSFKSGVPQFYNILKTGVNANDYHLTYGIGSGFSISPKYKLSFDLTYSSIWDRSTSAYQADLYRFMPGINYKLNRSISVSAGPGFSVAVGKPVNNIDVSRSFSPATVYDNFVGSRRIQMWIGGFLAFNLF